MTYLKIIKRSGEDNASRLIKASTKVNKTMCWGLEKSFKYLAMKKNKSTNAMPSVDSVSVVRLL